MKKKESKNLDFYYGSMGSGKTALLLISYYNCTKDNGFPVLLLKPSIDNRYGEAVIKSRIGISAAAIEVNKETDLIELVNKQEITPQMVMIDEVQFLSTDQIEQLKTLADEHGIAVDTYGLKINFRGNLFGEETGTIDKLLRVSNNQIQLRSFCACGNLASNVARYNPETWDIITTGPEILIGGNEQYIPLCYRDWKSGVVPELSRVRVLELLIEDEMKKDKVDSNKLLSLKARLENVKDSICIEQIEESSRIIEKETERIKILSIKNPNNFICKH